LLVSAVRGTARPVATILEPMLKPVKELALVRRA
jgi:hypothetical protein